MRGTDGFTLTTCGSQGRTGPNENQCRSTYRQVGWFAGANDGIQEVLIPTRGLWNIKVYGAQGGSQPSRNTVGALGAMAQGIFFLEVNDTLSVVVGQAGGGNLGSMTTSAGGGGGGGSFVWRNQNNSDDMEQSGLLIAAGGGGGADYYYSSSSYRPQPGQSGPRGTAGSYNGQNSGWPAAPNASGYGASQSSSGSGDGGPGAGWNSNGYWPQYSSRAGKSRLDQTCQFCGGTAPSSSYQDGGFGGGGATQNSGGGGGGFSGGGGGRHSYGGGGGGGSFVNEAFGFRSATTTGGNSNLDGFVEFELLAEVDWISTELPEQGETFVAGTCSASGYVGPSSCTYRSELFSLQSLSSGVQQFEVNRSGYYKIEAFGARGAYGYTASYRPGFGARTWGTFYLTAGTRVNVVVGQNSIRRTTSSSYGGGGGGGTYVWNASETTNVWPMLVAGGGGGASYGSTSMSYHGVDGQASPAGTSASYEGGFGGINGNGGRGGSNSGSGGGGAGWLSQGQSCYYSSSCGSSRTSNSFQGGQTSYSYGGYGGGAASRNEGGGGGGFSGGGGGYQSHGGGGGGGSWISGMNSGWETGGNVDSDGSVRFTLLNETVDDIGNSTYRFGTCGFSGRTGPTVDACRAAYRYSLPDNMLINVNYGLQRIRIQQTALYKITAAGAMGGEGMQQRSGTYYGGFGAIATGWFNLTAGEDIYIVVGQSGRVNRGHISSSSNYGGGGGGGSFVFTNSTALVIAGGGGGASYTSYRGGSGLASENGGDASPSGQRGGQGGSGAIQTQSSTNDGGPGAGWRSSGRCSYRATPCGKTGGINCTSECWYGGSGNCGSECFEGGFGGGGGGGRYEGGGGGGYSGGGGGVHSHGAGGGGGSFVGTFNGGVNEGANLEIDGYVLLEIIEETTLTSSVTTTLTSCGALGREGPQRLDECRNVYSPATSSDLTLDGVEHGIQQVTVRANGTNLYLMSAAGARGGDGRNSPNYAGGRGAIAWTILNLTQGDELSVVVGQAGSHCSSLPCTSSSGGGGGGGSMIWRDRASEPLLVAGGGGGASRASSSSNYNGLPGQAGYDGVSQSPSQVGGVNGSGSYVLQGESNGGAGGWKSDGDCSNSSGVARRMCGLGHPNGWIGGYGYASNYLEGGFGGGAGANQAGGAAGGYSGGMAYSNLGGGGGGSFIPRTSVSGWQTGGNKREEGNVQISRLPYANNAIFVTTCNSVGRLGPSYDDCMQHYDESVRSHIRSIQRGVQQFVVPSTGLWRIWAYGAAGGNSDTSPNTVRRSGAGALVQASFNLSAGDVLNIVVGQSGHNAPSRVSINAAGAGGGGTFVWMDGTDSPMLISGGGGGDRLDSFDPTSTVGQARMRGANGVGGGSGGFFGLGGDNSNSNAGAGGGWLTDGSCSDTTEHMCGLGYPLFHGGLEHGEGYMEGGFGGGGGAQTAAGGGGGFSGGGAGGSDGFGGGGGSFVSTNSTDAQTVAGGNIWMIDGLVVLEQPCGIGESVDATGRCVDINACLTFPCLGNASCVDIPGGSFGASGRICQCDTGYAGPRCEEINACIDHDCPGENIICRDRSPPFGNSPSGRECIPAPGYAYNSTGDVVSIDACLDNPCGAYATCIDLLPPADGSADGRRCVCDNFMNLTGDDCVCFPGRIMVNGRCVNDDACQRFPCLRQNSSDGIARYVSATCSDLPPPASAASPDGRTCTCPFPFIGNGSTCGCPDGLFPSIDETECVDSNPCAVAPCPANSICTPIPGGPNNLYGRTCHCEENRGYTGIRNMFNGVLEPPCVNIDACDSFPCLNQAVCVDLPPPALNSSSGRECTCGSGLTYDEGRGRCIDFNACANPNVTCYSESPNTRCFDRPAGYTGGAEYICIDPCAEQPCYAVATQLDRLAPECSANEGIQRPATWPILESEISVARRCTCPSGYEITSDGDCRDIDACTTSPCDNNAVCQDHPPPDGAGFDGRSCVCRDGFRGNGNICIAENGNGTTPQMQPNNLVSTNSESDSSSVWMIITAIFVIILIIVVIVGFVFMSKRQAVKYDMGSPAVENPIYNHPMGTGFENPQYLDSVNVPPNRPAESKPGYIDVNPISTKPAFNYPTANQPKEIVLDGFNDESLYQNDAGEIYETVDT